MGGSGEDVSADQPWRGGVGEFSFNGFGTNGDLLFIFFLPFPDNESLLDVIKFMT